MTKIKSLTEIRSIAQYLNRIGAEERSLRTAVVRETSGNYWRDIAVITIQKNGDVSTLDAFMPTEQEAAAIKSECAGADWPNHIKPAKIINPPDWIKNVDPENLFTFKDEQDCIVMLQIRIDDKQGGKAYIPATLWDDGEWRRMEPEGRLPVWGADQLSRFSTVFIHEGAKAARHCARLVAGKTEADRAALKAHPWGEEMAGAAHVGWIGGALSPSRTDWSILKRVGIQRAYIVSDNDAAGISAVPAISEKIRIPAFNIMFTSEFPSSFDLADAFPDKMFRKLGKARSYVGPAFRACLHPATWATDLVQIGKGRPTTVLREEFKEGWVYVEEADIFVNVEMPEIIRSEPVLNKMLAAFSHSQETGKLMAKNYRGRAAKLCYRPDLPGRIVTDKTTSAINLHTPTLYKSAQGDVTPWLNFLDYLIPNEEERTTFARWCATLIAKPDVRMEWGVLLISEKQGVGKTTAGEKILAPLVGINNAGFPSEDDIVNSPFNSWIANKRLVVIGEIYSGHSWKAYNRLKSYITDKQIECNQKFMRPYRIENFTHIFACSNSRKALKMENNDRRWFYPRVTENPWPKAKWIEFNQWLESGGLSLIKGWAETYGDYVTAGERAPMTGLKKEMIDESRGEGQREFAAFCETVVNDGTAVCFAMKDVVQWAKARCTGNFYDTDYELRKVAVEQGFAVLDERIKVGGTLQYMIVSPVMADEAIRNFGFEQPTRSKLSFRDLLTPDERKGAVGELKRRMKTPGDMVASDM